MNPSDLVITGLGMVTSIGIGRKAFTRSLLDGTSGVVAMPDVDTTQDERNSVDHVARRYRDVDGNPKLEQRTAVAAPICGFDAKLFVKPRKALKVMCHEIQTAYAASQLAVTDAGLDGFLPAELRARPGYERGGRLACDRIGTVFGSEMLYGNPSELKDAFAACITDAGGVDLTRFGAAATRGITPLWMLKYLPNMPACHFGIVVNAHGPNNTLTVGDTSGPAALIEACGYLRRGIADVMIVTAAGSRLNATRALFTEDQPIASVFDPPSRSSRPHAAGADGLVRGDGAGGLILEHAHTAEVRGHRPIARVAGYASRFLPSAAFVSGERTAAIRPDAGRGSTAAIMAAMRGALSMAGITADQLGGIVGHGFGDPIIDACERAAIEQLAPAVPLTLPAALLGHTSAASGMMSVLAACVMVQTQEIPPVMHAKDCPSGLNVSDRSRKLVKKHVLAIAHTSPGNATAVVIASC